MLTRIQVKDMTQAHQLSAKLLQAGAHHVSVDRAGRWTVVSYNDTDCFDTATLMLYALDVFANQAPH